MFSFRAVVPVGILATVLMLPACGSAQVADAGAAHDPAFEALQDRGRVAMGVDQYTSTHLFDALPEGGRIELQRGVDDPEGIEVIRAHLREIREAFSRGDFTTPAFVHSQDVPGTDVMAARRDRIEYVYHDLPRGGEVRLITRDPAALEAVHAFMAFQRDDHRAGGAGHDGMNHDASNHGPMSHGQMNHAPGRQGATDQSSAERTSHHLALGGGDAAFAADMDIVHELVTNHRAITRTVEHLPNGIRTLTESSSPRIAAVIVEHVASMESRLIKGAVFNLSSHTLPTIFENYDRIETEIVYSPTGVTLVQTSDDPALVEALQAHAAEVTELVDEGMIAMMRGMMTSGMMNGGRPGGMMQGGMHGMMGGGMHGGRSDGHAGQGQMNGHEAMPGGQAP